MNKILLPFFAIILLNAAAYGDKPPDAAMLTGEAVQTALSKYFSKPEHETHLICRSIFTPGSRHMVGDKYITVTHQDEIEAGKEVTLVRISEVAVREYDRLTVIVRLITWIEKGQGRLKPMHAFPAYEMMLNSEGILEVTNETLTVE